MHSLPILNPGLANGILETYDISFFLMFNNQGLERWLTDKEWVLKGTLTH